MGIKERETPSSSNLIATSQFPNFLPSLKAISTTNAISAFIFNRSNNPQPHTLRIRIKLKQRRADLGFLFAKKAETSSPCDNIYFLNYFRVSPTALLEFFKSSSILSSFSLEFLRLSKTGLHAYEKRHQVRKAKAFSLSLNIKKHLDNYILTTNSFSVQTVMKIRKKFIVIRGICRLASNVPAIPVLESIFVLNLFGALYIVANCVVEQLWKINLFVLKLFPKKFSDSLSHFMLHFPPGFPFDPQNSFVLIWKIPKSELVGNLLLTFLVFDPLTASARQTSSMAQLITFSLNFANSYNSIWELLEFLHSPKLSQARRFLMFFHRKSSKLSEAKSIWKLAFWRLN